MTAQVVFFSGVALLMVIRGIWEPKLKASMQLREGDLFGSPAALARLAVVRFLGTFSGLVAAGAGIAAILTYWVNSINVTGLSGDATPAGLEAVAGYLGAMRAINAFLPAVGLTLALIPIGLLFVGLSYWFFRSGRLVDARIRLEMSEIRRKLNANELEHMEPDRRMQEVEALIEKARANHADTETLYRLLHDLDILRRVDPSLLRQAGLESPPRPLWLRTMGLLVSGTVFRGMTCLASVVVVLATASLVPASLVFASKDLSGAVEQTTRALEDAERDLTLLIAYESARDTLDTYRAEHGPSSSDGDDVDPGPVEMWCDDDGRVLSENDCATAARFGRAFESSWASRIMAHAAIGESGNGAKEGEHRSLELDSARRSAEALAAERRQWARRQILIRHVRTRRSVRTPGPHEPPRAIPVDVVENTPRKDAQPASTVVEAALNGRSGHRAYDRPVTRDGRNAESNLRTVLRLRPDQITFPAGEAPLAPGELIKNAVLGIVSATVDLSEIDRQLPGPLGKALAGALGEGLSAAIESNASWRADAAYLARASDVASYSAAAEALREGRIAEDTVQALNRFVDANTVRRYREALLMATGLRFARPEPSERATVALDAGRVTPFDPQRVHAALLRIRPEGAWNRVDALATYSSVFPGVPGQIRSSPEAEMLAVMGRDPGPPDDHSASPGPGPQPPNPDGTPPGGGGMAYQPIPLNAPQLSEADRDSVSRARSYLRLRGFARVGGVLIGRPPRELPGTPALNLTDFRYTIDPSPAPALRMRFARNDGTAFELGPYDPAIAHFALAYAADGRPTTVTILPASPLHDQKILLHPALVETGMGCRTIRLDQFVDEFTGNNSSDLSIRREALAAQHSALVGLYRGAWALRFEAAYSQFSGPVRIEVHPVPAPASDPQYGAEPGYSRAIRPQAQSRAMLRRSGGFTLSEAPREPETRSVPEEELERLSELAVAIRKSEQSSEESVALAALQDHGNDAFGVFRERPVQFDTDLVNILDRCVEVLRKKTAEDGFFDCVRSEVSSEEAKEAYGESVHHAWLVPPPEVMTLSGVRERPYRLDRDLRFAAPPARWENEAQVQLDDGPFRFVVQTAIVPRAYFLGEDRQWAGVEYAHVDDRINQTPWEVRELEGPMQEAIAEAISEHAELRSIYWDMYEFVALQRLFRAALRGRFGIDFPVERLSAVAEKTGQYVNRKKIRTQRWLVREGDLERHYARELQGAVEQIFDKVGGKCSRDLGTLMEQCIRTLRSGSPSVSAIVLDCSVKEDFLERAQAGLCGESVHDTATKLQGWVDRLIGTRLLRREMLDVKEEWKARESALACPRP